MLNGGTGYIEFAGQPRFEFTVSQGAHAARLLLVAPTKEEADAMAANEGRLQYFRSAFMLASNQLFSAMPLDFESMLAQGEAWKPAEPAYGTCNTVPEIGVAMPDWLARHNVRMLGSTWTHQPMLDQLRLGSRARQYLRVLIENGFQGEPITVAWTPRPGVLAFARAILHGQPNFFGPPITDLKGFDWILVTTDPNGEPQAMAWHRF